MSAPFAALEARTNAVAMARLANAEAEFGAGPVPAIFDSGAEALAGGLVDAPLVTIQVLSAQMNEAGEGDEVVVTSAGQATTWTLRNPRDDGSGWTVAQLERVL